MHDIDDISSGPGPNGSLIPSIYIPAIPVVVDQHLQINNQGVLRLLIESDQWDSVISFQPGIQAALGGILDLEFADGTDVASQLGRNIRLFDWTGVSPTGTFTIGGPYVWDTSNLYTNGSVTLTAVPEPSAIYLATVAMIAICCLRTKSHRYRFQIRPVFSGE